MTSVQTPAQTAARIPAQHTPSGLGAAAESQRARLDALRAGLLAEQAAAVSPAVERALEMADAYLFLALGYLGHTSELFPGEVEAPPARP